MDEWGRGPWFDPNAPESSDPGETQAIRPHNSGGPRPTDAPPPSGRTPGASVPLSQRLRPDEWGDLDELAAAQGADPDISGGGPADSSGMRPRPTLSRPLYPPEPWNSYSGPNSGRFAPLSRPNWDNESQPLGQGFVGGVGGSGVGGKGTGGKGTGGPNQRGRGNGPGRRRSVLALLLVLLMLILLIGSIGFVLLNSPFKTASTTTATDTPTVMGTPTDTPSPTPIPPITAATVSLSPATKQLSGAGSMTSCPSGCSITGNTYSHSVNATSSPFPASNVPQSEVTGTITVTNNSSSTWSATDQLFIGGSYNCTVGVITGIPVGGTQPFACTVYIPSPSVIAAHTFKGNISGGISYDQPAALNGNGGYYVLSSDCNSAESNVEAPYGQTWANNWMASQSVPSGWALALSQPRFAFTNLSCPVGQYQSTAFNFTATVKANANDAAYDPGAAQSVAGSRRDNLLPAGYLWKSGSRTGCAPNVTGVSGNYTVTLNCSASGIAYVNWTDSMKANLAAAEAGLSKTAALGLCNNHTAGVASGSCSISITGGDGTLLPASASVITIQVNRP